MEILLSRLAELVGGEADADGDPMISGVAPFEQASDRQITMAENAKYLKRIEETRACAVIVPRRFTTSPKALLRADHPRVAFAKAVALFHPPDKPHHGVSPSACIGSNFSCGHGVAIGPYVVIQDNVTLGERVVLHPHVVIGRGVQIGDDVVIHAHCAILDHCRIGNRVIIHAGAIIGSDGYGFASDGEKYHKIPQLGIVQIDDDVDIGARCTIDRATFGRTWLQQGVKIDNLVQIGHNVEIGAHTVIVAQVGIAGSTKVGHHCIIAGQVGISGHLSIGDQVIIGPQAGIAQSIPDGQVITGSPGIDHKRFLRAQRVFADLPELNRKLIDLQRRLERLEKNDP